MQKLSAKLRAIFAFCYFHLHNVHIERFDLLNLQRYNNVQQSNIDISAGSKNISKLYNMIAFYRKKKCALQKNYIKTAFQSKDF